MKIQRKKQKTEKNKKLKKTRNLTLFYCSRGALFFYFTVLYWYNVFMIYLNEKMFRKKVKYFFDTNLQGLFNYRNGM